MVMHRSLKPADVGSIPTDPTDKQVSGFRNQVSVDALKPEVWFLKSDTDL